MYTFIKISFKTLLLLAFLVAVPVFAAEIRLDTNKSKIKSGEEFLVNIVIYSEDSINAIEGQLVFPTENLVVKEIRDGNSIINFWVDKPHVEESGTILFSGITPGGFSGINNNIFSVVFEAQDPGIASVSLQNTKALKNDGFGTEITLANRNTNISIKSGDSSVIKEELTDTALPEDFTPIISSDPNIFDGKHFLVFATQDKDSGINRYEVREGRWNRFETAESPYLLKYQELDKDIYVKAVDNVGNERVVTILSNVPSPWWEESGVLIIFMVLISAIASIYRRIRCKRNNKIIEKHTVSS